MANFNLDHVEQLEGLYFTFAQFEEYLASRGIEVGDSFTSPPIQIIDSDRFEDLYRVGDIFQSGEIHYLAK